MEGIKIHFNEDKKHEFIKIINKISLKERRQRVENELEKEKKNPEDFKFLLLMDNTNEDLLYQYIQSLNTKNIYDKKIIEKYSNYMGLSKLNALQKEKFGDSDQGFRKVSYKVQFFRMIYDIIENDEDRINSKIETLKTIIKASEINNQPFDYKNVEVFYFNLYELFLNQIEDKIKTEGNDYLDSLKDYIISISNELKKYEPKECNKEEEKKEEYKNVEYKKGKYKKEDYKQKNIFEKKQEVEKYEEEKKNIKKFLAIFFSIINFDAENSNIISQVTKVFLVKSDEDRKKMISYGEDQLNDVFGKNAVDKFKKILEDKKIYNSLNIINNITYLRNKIEIPEECFSYDYIIQNNIFKKYEDKIKQLMKKIFESDLFKSLVRIIYKTEDNDMNYFFEENNFVEDFWDNNIIFVPFKIKRVSGFSYKDSFLFFFSIYKIKNFDSEIEDEIFTLGAFVRVLMHEVFGHLIISYIFYMFCVNIGDYTKYYTPRMNNQLKELNKNKLCEFIGDFLAKIIIDNLNYKKNKEFLYKKFGDSLKNKLLEEFTAIIGKDYSEKLIQILFQNNDILTEKNLNNLSMKIIDILINLISEEFDKYINDLKYKEEKYKNFEFGNIVEFLLFNNFDQYMSLKECLFLLNEDNYENGNFIKFSSEFKNLVGKKSCVFIDELNNGNKIFSDLFAKYKSIYEKNKNINNDLISKRNFRGGSGHNLNKKFEAFECFNIGRNWLISQKMPEV